MDTGSDYVKIDMNKVRVRIYDVADKAFVEVLGEPVTIGVLSDMFVATPHYHGRDTFGVPILSDSYDITHVPSGAAITVYAESVAQAVKIAEERIRAAGAVKYAKGVGKAMRATAHLRKMKTGTSLTTGKAVINT